MQIVHRAMGLWKKRSRPRYALALAGGGVIGGMYEVGALSALEERLASRHAAFDIYVGCSAGSVVAALLASGIRASEIYQIHDEDLDDPLNMLVTNEPAARKLSSPISAPSSTMLPMPMRQRFPTVHPCRITRCPMVHSMPMVV